MSHQIHDNEPDTSEATVRALLQDQFPEAADWPMAYLRTSGTDNTMWKLSIPDGSAMVVRLPRSEGAAERVCTELKLLPLLSQSPLRRLAAVPTVRHAGVPSEAFPHHWAVLDWLDGVDAWSVSDDLTRRPTKLAEQLGAAIRTMRSFTGLPVRERSPGDRGGPLAPLLDVLDRWLTDPRWEADRLLDVAAIRRLGHQAAEVADQPSALQFVHGDLIPGNLLTDQGELTAIIDWGGAGYGDQAQDLAPAWAAFDEPARTAFRHAVDVDEPTWLRACAFELEHAVGGILYYEPRGHPLADVMRRTLDRILATR